MILLNFAHAISDVQLSQMHTSGLEIAEIRSNIDTNVDLNQELAPQVVRLVDEMNLSPKEWQNVPFVVRVPSFPLVAVLVIAEIHGRSGYFPNCVNIVPSEIRGQFNYIDQVSLSVVREEARKRR
jgi:hypothetical protein